MLTTSRDAEVKECLLRQSKSIETRFTISFLPGCFFFLHSFGSSAFRDFPLAKEVPEKDMEPKDRYGDVYKTEHEVTMGAAGMSRKRVPHSSNSQHTHPGVYEELEELRNLVDEFDNERPGCCKGSVDGSLMSTVFAIVLVMILSISVYAFSNLFKAVMRRFYKDGQ